MNTWSKVNEMLTGWLNQIGKGPETVVKLANACIGWPYVFGGRGEQCTPANRRTYYANKQKETIKTKCKNFNGSESGCSGCAWHPGGVTLFFDCRGFTYWLLLKAAGIKIEGAGATSQWNNAGNWAEKGLIANMPRDKVCCVFRYDENTKKMEHTLLYDGEGHYIHCSGEVKKCATGSYAATHYAIPKGLYGGSVKPSQPEQSGQTTPGQSVLPTPGKGEAVVIGRKVALRNGPSTTCGVITRIDTGEIVKEINPPDGWAYVSYNGKTGYMMKQFLKEG